MEERKWDAGGGGEGMTTLQNNGYTRRTTYRTASVGDDHRHHHQVNKNYRRKTILSTAPDEHRYPPVILPSERNSSTMKSSTLPQYLSNPSLLQHSPPPPSTQQQEQKSHEEEISTYSFRHVTKKLQHAKSHGELYQPSAPLPLPPMLLLDDDYTLNRQQRYNPDAPKIPLGPSASTRARTATTIVPIITRSNQFDETTLSASSPNKVPLWKRFKRMIVPTKRGKEQPPPPPKVPILQLADMLSVESPNSNRTVLDGATTSNNHLLQNPIKLNELRTWIISKPFPEQRIREEYDRLPIEPLHPKTVALRPENKPKNRFNAIEPYDHSRVILKPLPNDPSSDYINACYIDGYRSNKLYIASQAPTDVSLYDFYRMIWQYGIQSIVMVTRLFEEGKCKCIQYWPDEGEKRVNELRLRIESEEKYADYTIRRFTMYDQAEPSEELTIKQYHFLTWPDHGCLPLSTPLLDFRQRFRADYKPSGPVLVHCSAGVGRSGTFIALDALLEAAVQQDSIDVFEFTYRMRQNRVYMIQTVDQYAFLYRTLIEGIVTMGASVGLQEFMSTRKTHMDVKTQYKLLEQFQSTIEFIYRGALDPANVNKNRIETILAADGSRPYLMTQVDKTTDYINAVFINAYRQVPNYIATQYPLPHTHIDFWRLVYDHNASIIMLLESIPRDPKNIPYWSSTINQSAPFGPFDVVMTSIKDDDHLIERVFELRCTNKSSLNTDRTRTIRQFQVKDNARLLPIVKRFLKEMRTRTDQNVILQCLNGTNWCGYFAALCNAIDKMQTEHIVDPFKVVRLLRANRSQFIDQNQYENLFLAMFDYAQQYWSASMSSHRAVENSVYMNASGYDESPSNNRIVQRL